MQGEYWSICAEYNWLIRGSPPRCLAPSNMLAFVAASDEDKTRVYDIVRTELPGANFNVASISDELARSILDRYVAGAPTRAACLNAV